MFDTRFEKARNLLVEILGEGDYNAFVSGRAISFDINEKQLKLFKVGSTTCVYYGSNSGRIYGNETRQFDTLVALIQQLKQGLPVDWACGNLGAKLPDEMPPVDLSLWG